MLPHHYCFRDSAQWRFVILLCDESEESIWLGAAGAELKCLVLFPVTFTCQIIEHDIKCNPFMDSA